jgi:DNA polymerase
MPSSPVNDALVALVRHLEERRAHGEEFVWLSPKARKELRELPKALVAAPTRTAPTPPPQPDPTPPVAQARVEPDPILSAAVATPKFVPQGATKSEKLAWLAQRAKDCPEVRALDSLRETLIFSTGNPDARILFVGDAPGPEEERQGEPFVGPAGNLLTKMIAAMGLKREETYITNILKFRPAVPNQGESTRKPSREEMAVCLGFVQAEIEVVKPEVIVALGTLAALGLLGSEEPVARLRNRFHSFEGIPLMVTFHPSYLLRYTDLSERRKVWEDLLLVMEQLQLPISPKQRAYFTG